MKINETPKVERTDVSKEDRIKRLEEYAKALAQKTPRGIDKEGK